MREQLLLVALLTLLATVTPPAALGESAVTAQQAADALLTRMAWSSDSSADEFDGQAIGMAMVMRVMEKQNKTGKVPTLVQINAWTKQVHGDQAITFKNATAEAEALAAAATAHNESSTAESSKSIPSATSEQGASSSRMSRQMTTPPMEVLPRTGPLVGPTAVVPAQPPITRAPAPTAPTGLFRPGENGRDVVLEVALRRIRYGVYQAIFGWTQFAAAQLSAVAAFLLIAHEVHVNDVAFILQGVANEVSSIGFAAVGSV